MAKIWEPHPIQVYLQWIEDICEESYDELTSWEVTFIESVENRLRSGFNLTEAQSEKLESIYTEKTK